MKALALALSISFLGVPALAAGQPADQASAEAALAAAQKLEGEAAALKNRWIPTETALKAATAAFKDSHWDEAKASADQAAALAQASIAQAHEEQTAWRDAVIH